MSEDIDFKSLVLDHDAIDKNETVAKSKPKAKPTIEVVEVSGIDLVLRRTTKTTSKLLVLLASQEQYFIKDERTGKVDILVMRDVRESKKLRTGDTYDAALRRLGTFLQGCDQMLETGSAWLPKVSGTMEFKRALIRMLLDDDLQSMAKAGLAVLIPPANTWDKKWRMNYSGLLPREREMAVEDKATARLASPYVSNNPSFIDEILSAVREIIGAVGLDEARKILSADECKNTSSLRELAFLLNISENETENGVSMGNGLRLDSRYRTGNRRKSRGQTIRFDSTRLIEYLSDDARRQGFDAYNPKFIQTWADALVMQIVVYGSVIDKYPDALLTMHHVLSREANEVMKRRQMELDAEQAERDKSLWSNVVSLAEPYLKSNDGFIVLTPAADEDMIDEARQQHNCLASYIDRAKIGETSIFFIRREDAPTESVVTVEVDPASKRIVQAYGPCNSRVYGRERDFLLWWADECGLSYAA